MDKEYYERKLKDILVKCPIEAGVEMLVYNLLDSIIDSSKYSLINITTLKKGKDRRLQTNGGIPDMAIVAKEFEYRKSDKEQVFAFVEVKLPQIPVKKRPLTKQITGHISQGIKFIYTNGLSWQYYEKGVEERKWEVNLASANDFLKRTSESIIIEERYNELVKNLEEINWCV